MVLVDVLKAVIGGSTAVTAVTDKVTDFEVGVDKLDLTTTTAAVDKASTDVSGAVSGGLAAGETLTASVADGVITLAGNATAKVDTVSELIDIFELMDKADTADTLIEMGGSSYVISDEANNNRVIEVVELTGHRCYRYRTALVLQRLPLAVL